MNRIGNQKYHPKKQRHSKKGARMSELREKKKEEKSKTDESEQSEQEEPGENQPAPKPPEKLSTTSRKLQQFESNWDEETATTVDFKYIFIHVDKLCDLVSEVKCSVCQQKTMTVDVSETYGFANKLKMHCTSCQYVLKEEYSCPRLEDNTSHRPPFHVNRKLTEAMLCMGSGYAGLQKFSMALDMNNMSKNSFLKHLEGFSEDINKMKSEMLAQSRLYVRQVLLDLDKNLSDSDVLNYTCSYDGTYQRRGHKSHYGVCFVIEVITGLVIDFVILSNYCYQCVVAEKKFKNDDVGFQEWLQCHKQSKSCQKNFDGSSTMMEVVGAEILWKRSIETCQARYTTILSDGDAKTFQHLKTLKVYGNTIDIMKEDCTNHVAKRMKTGLKNLVKEWAIKKVTLGGKKQGALTDKVIDHLTSYYRNAIVQNAPDIEKMRMAVLAPLYHYASTDEDPQHDFCPKGERTWCWYNQACFKKRKPPSHETKPPKINATVIEKISELYKRLSMKELLERCTKTGTQNANESLHNVVWSKCSKEKFQSLKKLHIAVILAVSEFNMGCEVTIRLKNTVQNEIMSTSAHSISVYRDQLRIKNAKLYEERRLKRAEQRKQALNKTNKSKRRKTDPLAYASGSADL